MRARTRAVHLLSTLRPSAVARPCAVALLAAALTGCAPEAPAQAEASEADVRAAFDDFAGAFQAQDLDGVLAAFTEDAVAIDPPAPPGIFRGSEGIGAWAGGAFQAFDRIEIDIRDPSVRTQGSAGWVTAYYVFQATAAGMPEPYTAEGWVSMVFVRDEEGTYRSTLFQASPVAES
jgi:ketosteroid isomerase-like protein